MTDPTFDKVKEEQMRQGRQVAATSHKASLALNRSIFASNTGNCGKKPSPDFFQWKMQVFKSHTLMLEDRN